jgi:protein-S-isoprenylcysteine O-methyltransferase Ste14
MHPTRITIPPVVLERWFVHNRPMGPQAASLTALSFAWIAYGALHSLLAAAGTKRWVAARGPRLMPAYRLLYNLFALVSLLPLLWLLWRGSGPWLWRWHGGLAWVMNGLGLFAIGLLLAGPGIYDLSEFLGLRQLREGRDGAEDQEPFRISTLHRYVRHPWYALSLVVLWTRDMDAASLVSALWITAYFILGSRLEERKLLMRFGEAYREYMTLVPGFMPRPWKALSREEARRLAGG